jgi:cysteine-rich repeat protein
MRTIRSLAFAAVLAIGALPLAACVEEAVPTDSSAEALTAADCTLTLGFWKTHAEAWPVASLKLGNVTYSKAQLLSIFNQPVSGNGLVALAHQLIAAKLNVANGASPGSVAAAIAGADAQIGGLVVPPVGSGKLSPGSTSARVAQLDSYNRGVSGPGHCGDTPPPPPPPVCGNGVLESGELCDDGNTANGDGCSSTCAVEPPPPPPPACGNGVLESGELCDDGNLANGDGCSCTCTVEPPPPPPPVCGNGVLESDELCDDGNLANGDGCSCTCTVEPPPPVCGNGVLEGDELCDDGNTVGGDGCSSDCLCTET